MGGSGMWGRGRGYEMEIEWKAFPEWCKAFEFLYAGRGIPREASNARCKPRVTISANGATDAGVSCFK